MSTTQFRPTFSLPTKNSPLEVIGSVKRLVESMPLEYQGQFTNEHAMISIVDSKRHFWSPCLQLELRQNDQQREIFGRFSPHPSIWTAIMLTHLAIGISLFFALMVGVAQQLSGESPWAYGVVPIGLLMALGLWFISQTGQRLAHQEMTQMRLCIEQDLAKNKLLS